MTDLFYMGGPLVMGILTLMLLAILAIAIYRGVLLSRNGVDRETTFRYRLTHIKSLGLLALIIGIFAQMLGLYDAFTAIEMAGDISPALLAGGLKVSMVTTLYGMAIFLISWLVWMVLDYRVKNREAV